MRWEAIFVKVIIKWPKTIQNRDSLHFITLPRVRTSHLCPYKAIRAALQLYEPTDNEPLFQYYTAGKWLPLTDTRIRKCLSKLNVQFGYPPHHFTFHAFRRSGATLAYNSDVPIGDIMHHGSWASECVWTYIQEGHKKGEQIASSLANAIC